MPTLPWIIIFYFTTTLTWFSEFSFSGIVARQEYIPLSGSHRRHANPQAPTSVGSRTVSEEELYPALLLSPPLSQYMTLAAFYVLGSKVKRTQSCLFENLWWTTSKHHHQHVKDERSTRLKLAVAGRSDVSLQNPCALEPHSQLLRSPGGRGAARKATHSVRRETF